MTGMAILGLTGSVGMGKSTAATLLRRLGVPVHDADAAVHGLLGTGGGAVAAVGSAFPGTVEDGAVNRVVLGKEVFGDAERLRALEGILHPRVRASEDAFLRRHALRRAPLVVLDIPLLYETGAEVRLDAVVTVTAPAFLQEIRVLRRRDMSRERLAALRAAQVPDVEKRRRADYVVVTGGSKHNTLKELRRVVADVRIRLEPRRAVWRPGRAALPGGDDA